MEFIKLLKIIGAEVIILSFYKFLRMVLIRLDIFIQSFLNFSESGVKAGIIIFDFSKKHRKYENFNFSLENDKIVYYFTTLMICRNT
jgi:hypothetical protein